MPSRNWFARNRRLLGLAAIVVTFSSIGGALFTRSYVAVLHDGFRGRSLAYAKAFAATAASWIDDTDPAMLRSAARLVLAGSALYVQIAAEDGLIVDERSAAAEGLDLEWEAEFDAARSETVYRRHGASHLDLLVPLTAERRGKYVRIGIDRTSLVAQSNSAMVIAGGATIGFDALLILALAVALRSRRRRWPMETGADVASPEGSTLTAGRLAIDRSRKTVHLDDRPVPVTPKQFALLELLATRPGHVFSEEEILDAAWPDSPYADSKDIKQYVYLIRRRLVRIDSEARSLIETVPGFGYRLTAEDVDRELT